MGYKIARIKLNIEGNYLGEEDFISEWLTSGNESLGRPVDTIIQSGGDVYMSDDKAKLVYKVVYK